MTPFNVGILVVSDTSYANPSSDKTGPLLHDLLTSVSSEAYNVTHSHISRDDVDEVRAVVKAWCDEGLALVLTAGGTGFGVRDNTPEALSPLIDKPASGLVTAMLTSSLAITPLAALARPVAGVHINADGTGTMIVSLPGSPKGAKENLESLLSVLPHALEQIGGANTRAVHAIMRKEGGPLHDSVATRQTSESLPPAISERAGGCGSHHHHHAGHPTPKSRTALLSQDPSSNVASRQRKSPYPIISYAEAIQHVLDNSALSPIQTISVTEQLTGHVLAEEVIAPQSVPLQPTSNVDGYAVRSTDGPGVYEVVTVFPRQPLPAGSIYRINTGAPLPPGLDSVIMVEDTEVVTSIEGEEREVKLLAKVDLGENVRKPGSDVKQGEKVLDKGDVISPVGGELGSLAFVSQRSVKVYRRPKVAVLSTGNELVNLQDRNTSEKATTAFEGIVDSNRLSLISMLRHLHFDVLDLGIVEDTMDETKKALTRGKEECDVIVTTGGTSMGVGDLLKPCIEQEMSGTIHFGRVAIKPGKPTTFATLPAHPMAPDRRPRLVFALPGNPASALVTFFIFVLPALRKMEGRLESEWQLPRVPVTLNETVPLDPRAEYHRVWLRPTATGLTAFSTGGQRSSRTVSLAGCNGLLELPPSSPTDKERKAGEVVACVVIGELGSMTA
ncbi:hypothetical protein OIV83_005437 [Microbotryomycetes sp. JL201]|nr:hypothetical protein OIV83_005437 [Microbotryomycetes sp. JL201]